MRLTSPTLLVAPLLLSSIAAAACGGARASERTQISTKEMFERYKPAIVRIVGEAHAGVVTIGTGFVVGADGRIATNLHVIEGTTKVTVELADGTKLPVNRVVAANPDYDLVVIGVAAKDLPTLRVGDSDQVATGDRVVAIGNPLGVLDYTVSDGLISSVRELEGRQVLQISAPISVGSSGGPLFNSYGEVIGIATAISRAGQNLNFGMPSNYLRPLLDQRGGVPLAEFQARSGAAGRPDPAPAQPRGSHPPVTRRVPQHALSVLDGCSDEKLVEVAQAIGRAIEMGAPIYNMGEYEACFVIYRNTASQFEADQGACKGVREAFGHGLLRASSLDDPAAQAWAMRDTFDGLLDVIMRKLQR